MCVSILMLILSHGFSKGSRQASGNIISTRRFVAVRGSGVVCVSLSATCMVGIRIRYRRAKCLARRSGNEHPCCDDLVTPLRVGVDECYSLYRYSLHSSCHSRYNIVNMRDDSLRKLRLCDTFPGGWFQDHWHPIRARLWEG